MTDKRRTTRSTTMTTSLQDSYTILFDSYKSHSKQIGMYSERNTPSDMRRGKSYKMCSNKNKQFFLSIFSPVFTFIDIGTRLHWNVLNGINSKNPWIRPHGIIVFDSLPLTQTTLEGESEESSSSSTNEIPIVVVGL